MLGLLVYSHVFKVMEKNKNDYNNQVMNSINQKLENILDKLNNINYFVYSKEAQEYLNALNSISDEKSFDYFDKYTKLLKSYNAWSGIFSFYNIICKMMIVTNKGSFYFDQILITYKNKDYFSKVLYKSIVKSNKTISAVYFENKKSQIMMKNNEYAKYLIVGKKIVNTGENPKSNILGVIYLIMEWKDIESVLNNLVKNEKTNYLIIEKDSVIYNSNPESNIHIDIFKINNFNINSNNENDFISVNINQKNYLVSTYSSSLADWKFVSISDAREINKDILNIKNLTLLMTLLSLIIAIVISFFLTYSILKPISQLGNFAKEIEIGNLKNRVDLRSYTELNLLAGVINSMTERLNNTIEQNLILVMRQRESELKALQAQVNPHFLFNALNAINAHAQIYEIKEIADITYALSDILRYNLKNSNELITIDKEIDNVKKYLSIQNIRYNNTINTYLNIENKVMECKSIKFFLQPIVENSLQHGLERKEGYKELIINGFIEGSYIVIQVFDNGIGIKKSRLDEIQNILTCHMSNNVIEKFSSNSIGIFNVHQRLKLIFGSEYGIRIDSKFGKGTKVIILLPLVQ